MVQIAEEDRSLQQWPFLLYSILRAIVLGKKMLTVYRGLLGKKEDAGVWLVQTRSIEESESG
jgi:hypothetical protein